MPVLLQKNKKYQIIYKQKSKLNNLLKNYINKRKRFKIKSENSNKNHYQLIKNNRNKEEN